MDSRDLLKSLHDTFATITLRKTRPWLKSTDDVKTVVDIVEQCLMSGMYEESKWDEPNDLWSFFGSLQWLHPKSLKLVKANALDQAIAATFLLQMHDAARNESVVHVICPNERIRHDRGLRWLYEQIATRQRLSRILKYLVNNEALIGSLYKDHAFVRNAQHLNALLQCLRSLEVEQRDNFDTVPWMNNLIPMSGNNINTMAKLSLERRGFGSAPLIGAGHETVVSKDAEDIAEILPMSRPLSRAKSLILRKTTRTFAATPASSTKSEVLVTKKTPIDHRDTHIDQALQPIKLVKCDDIKIHFDHKHAARVAADAQVTSTTLAAGTSAAAAIPIERPPVPQGLLYSLLPMLSKSPPAPNNNDNSSKFTVTAEGSVSPSLYAQFLAASAPSELVNAFIPREGEKLYERRSQSSLSTTKTSFGGTPGHVVQRDQFELYAPDEYFVAGTMDDASDVLPSDQRRQQQLMPSATNGIGRGVGGSNYRSTSSSNNSSTGSSCCSSGSAGFGRTEHSLTQFLQSSVFSCTNSDLERENAHFSVSEAMISAIEQMKCRKLFQAQADELERLQHEDEYNGQKQQQQTPIGLAMGRPVMSDFEMRQRRLAASQDTNDKYRRAVMSGASGSSTASSFSSTLLLKQKISATPPSHSQSLHHQSLSSSSVSYEPSSSCPDDRSPVNRNKSMLNPRARAVASSPLQTLSMHPPIASSSSTCHDDEPTTDTSADECRAYAEWGATRADTWSAESVALSLISKFSDLQLPRASELFCLVSEQDAPQKLLPLPGSWAVNPDEPYKIPFTRGTRDWAPPRAQVIFTQHAKSSRKELLERQNFRCAGCGMRVAAAYSNRFRYCEYLGRYHCTNCHRNQIAVIPAHVLHDWDFANRPVSVFAYRLLEQIACVPVFRVAQFNCALYSRIRALQLARQSRGQLRFVRDFVVACRFAVDDGTKRIFEQVAAHIVDDMEAWSMSDFQAVRSGSFARDIAAVLARCEEHIIACELCTARGFVCERCKKSQVIFPWQPKVRRCPACGVCVHAGCWKATEECTRCERLRERRAAAAVAAQL